jgi:hypothetical protein
MNASTRRGLGRRAGVLIAAAAAWAVGALAVADAAPRHDRAAGGTTTVTLNQATIGVVVNTLGLTPAAVAPGTLGIVGADLQAAFPIRGEIRDGQIRHRGGLSLTKGGTTLSLTRYTIDTTKGVLTARAAVNGKRVGRIELFDLGAAPAKAGCAATASLALDAAAAGALVSVFGLPVQPSAITGVDFGTACVAPAPKVVPATTVTLNQATIGAVVNTLGLTPGAIAPGTLGASGADLLASFPIVGEIEHGIIRHRGGLSFTNGATTLALTDYVINTRRGGLFARAAVNGKGAGWIRLFDLGAAPAKPGCAATASLALDTAAAGALVAVFGLPVQPSAITGLDFGTACVVPGAGEHGGDDHRHGHIRHVLARH